MYEAKEAEKTLFASNEKEKEEKVNVWTNRNDEEYERIE